MRSGREQFRLRAEQLSPVAGVIEKNLSRERELAVESAVPGRTALVRCERPGQAAVNVAAAAVRNGQGYSDAVEMNFTGHFAKHVSSKQVHRPRRLS